MGFVSVEGKEQDLIFITIISDTTGSASVYRLCRRN